MHATLVAPDEDENPRFDMPWHVSTLYEDQAQYIAPLHFIIFCRGLIYQVRGFSG